MRFSAAADAFAVKGQRGTDFICSSYSRRELGAPDCIWFAKSQSLPIFRSTNNSRKNKLIVAFKQARLMFAVDNDGNINYAQSRLQHAAVYVRLYVCIHLNRNFIKMQIYARVSSERVSRRAGPRALAAVLHCISMHVPRMSPIKLRACHFGEQRDCHRNASARRQCCIALYRRACVDDANDINFHNAATSGYRICVAENNVHTKYAEELRSPRWSLDSRAVATRQLACVCRLVLRSVVAQCLSFYHFSR